jgi:acyl-CoA thioester hydrolase
VSYHQQVRVRYGECDMQGVVFNAHYLAYCDDAVDTWLRQVLPGEVYSAGGDGATFDFMTKTAAVTWYRGLRFGELADLDCSVSRFGRTSFDITIEGSVAGEPSFTTNLTYVSVEPGTHRPCPVPDHVRVALTA